MEQNQSVWFISDTHFNHVNILKYEVESRPFESIEEMNEVIVKNWNSVIKENDIVYMLGDFFLGSPDKIMPILTRLNGYIHLIRGNHDSDAKLKIYQEYGIPIKEVEYLKYKGLFFVMCHFPIISEDFLKMITQDNEEVVFLYGHVHGKAPKGLYKNTFHVGVDTNDLTPINAEQIWQEYIHQKEE